jgi:antitoxin PrlF
MTEPGALSLLFMGSKELPVHAFARVTSKGQVTIPKEVREALGINEGDGLHFRVAEGKAVVRRTRTVDELAGSVPVPEELRGASWEEIKRRTREARAKKPI